VRDRVADPTSPHADADAKPDAVTERSSTPSLADVTPFAAVVTALGAIADAPPTRRSRRTVTVGEQTLVTQVPAATPIAAPAPAVTAAPVLDPVLIAAEPFELLEPEIDETLAVAEEDIASRVDDAQGAASEHTAAENDAFEAAARLFSFTGETQIQSAKIDDTDAPGESATQQVAPQRNRGASFKRLTATSFSVGVMGIVGLLTVGLTTPADAVAAPGGTDITSSLIAATGGDVEAGADDEIQAYVTPSEVENAAIDRAENYTTLTMAQLASQSGIANYSNFFINDPTSPVQWPFAVGVPISYGFGMRDGSMHEGADFTPGEGSPIQAIADGVVRESTESGGAFGVHIVIDHVIDGQLISSSYSHMLYGSRQVQVGDQVAVGTVIGHTGNTGRSFGAHTHFEMLANGTTPIDPIPWLREHAGG
jgi:murein DD-endopeptidase MepM/ murein hydrolase activator NlpD